jgi:hypothetical protein
MWVVGSRKFDARVMMSESPICVKLGLKNLKFGGTIQIVVSTHNHGGCARIIWSNL